MEFVRYDYPMTDAQMIALTSWPTLAERKPDPGQHCEFHMLHLQYHDYGEGKFGIDEYVPSGYFLMDRGQFVGDPAVIYWRPT